MANDGLFQPTFLEGSSMQGESFVKQPVQMDISAVGDLLQTGANIYGQVMSNKAEKQIQQEEQRFLDNLDQNRKDQAILAQLEQEAAPHEKASFDDAKRQITTLQEAINSRDIDPVSAMTRIEGIKKKYKNLAPNYAHHIDSLTTKTTPAFSVESRQLIKEQNDLRDAVLASGLNPDNPYHVQRVMQDRQNEAQVKRLAAEEEIYTSQNISSISDLVNNKLIMMSEQINSVVDNINTGQISEKDRMDLINQTQAFTGDSAGALFDKLMQQNGVDISKLDPEFRQRNIKMMSSAAENQIKILNGSLPKEVAANSIALAKDNVMLNFKNKYPDTFEAMTVLSAFPADSIASAAFRDVVGVLAGDYIKELAVNRRPISTLNGTQENPGKTQEAVATSFKQARDWFRDNIDTASPSAIKGTYEIANNQIEALIDSPRSFSPKIYTEMLDYMTDDTVMKALGKTDPSLKQDLVSKAPTLVNSYLQESFAVALSKKLDDGMNMRQAKGRRVSDFVQPVIENGVLSFKPKEGFENNADRSKAEIKARELDRQFSPIVSKTAYLISKYGTSIQKEDIDATLSVLLEGPLSKAGTPLSDTIGTVENNSATPLQDALKGATTPSTLGQFGIY